MQSRLLQITRVWRSNLKEQRVKFRAPEEFRAEGVKSCRCLTLTFLFVQSSVSSFVAAGCEVRLVQCFILSFFILA